MATKEAAIKAKLTGSSAWTTLVTGGTFIWDDLGRNGLDQEAAVTQGCYDTAGKLKLTAVITFGTASEREILKSQRQFFRVFLYHDNSYPLIRQAVRLAYDTLNAQQVAADAVGSPLIRWVDDMQEYVADELDGAMAGGGRFYCQFSRK
jgi:hypothetical protein